MAEGQLDPPPFRTELDGVADQVVEQAPHQGHVHLGPEVLALLDDLDALPASAGHGLHPLAGGEDQRAQVGGKGREVELPGLGLGHDEHLLEHLAHALDLALHELESLLKPLAGILGGQVELTGQGREGRAQVVDDHVDPVVLQLLATPQLQILGGDATLELPEPLDGPDPGIELDRIDGLAQEVVGPGIQRQDRVLDLRAGGDQQDVDLLGELPMSGAGKILKRALRGLFVDEE